MPGKAPPDWLVAYHEAGHAVAAAVWTLHFHRVDIHRRDDPPMRGNIDARRPSDNVLRGMGTVALPWLIYWVAPHAAEEAACEARWCGCTHDYREAWELAELAADGAEVTADDLMATAEEVAARLVHGFWSAIRRVARTLKRRRELSRRQVERLVWPNW